MSAISFSFVSHVAVSSRWWNLWSSWRNSFHLHLSFGVLVVCVFSLCLDCADVQILIYGHSRVNIEISRSADWQILNEAKSDQNTRFIWCLRTWCMGDASLPHMIIIKKDTILGHLACFHDLLNSSRMCERQTRHLKKAHYQQIKFSQFIPSYYSLQILGTLLVFKKD